MNKTILVADDSPVQAIMLRRTLSQAGFQVLMAKNGIEALETLKKQPIDLIISDVNMPKMDGYELCRIIKQDAQLCRIPLILCTTLADPMNLIKGIEVGASNYITKPWNDENLLTLIDGLLRSPSYIKLGAENSEEVTFNGQSYKIHTGYQEILNFLLTTYQNIHKQNQELIELREEVQKAYSQLASTQKEQEQILHNIFPEKVAQELIAYGSVEPMRYEEATVMFIDFVGFSKSTLQMNPQDLVEALGFYFEKFDELINQRQVERIKTIGDGYMCVGGIPTINTTHPIDCTLAALDILKFVQENEKDIQNRFKISWQIRIGIHTGPLVAGVVGKSRLAFDIWGETVNLASRMQTHSDPNKINISSDTYQKIKDFFICQPRGAIKIKNKEGIEELSMEMYFVDGINPDTNLR